MKVIAYVSDSSQYDHHIENYQYITDINYCFATVKDFDGNLKVDFQHLDKLFSIKRRYPHLKLILSIGGWTAGNFSEMAEKLSSRTTFITQVIAFIKANDFDGVDLDWEYPGSGASGISYHFEDKANYSILSQELRDMLNRLSDVTHKTYTLSVAVAASIDGLDSFDINILNELYDYINIMHYDYIGMDRLTCHHANLYDSALQPHKKSAAYFTNEYLKQGLDPKKIIFGIPFYGRGASGVTLKKTPIGSRIYGEIPKFYDYQDIMKRSHNAEHVFFDEEAQAAYYFDGDTFISYENRQSITKKMRYLKENKFAGVMFWEYATDQTGLLFSYLRESLNND